MKEEERKVAEMEIKGRRKPNMKEGEVEDERGGTLLHTVDMEGIIKLG